MLEGQTNIDRERNTLKDLREGLTKADSCALSKAIYERAYKYYCKQMVLKIAYILGIALLGLTSIIGRAITGSTTADMLAVVSYVLLLLQVVTLPNGVVKDRLGNRFDLNSGIFTPNDG